MTEELIRKSDAVAAVVGNRDLGFKAAQIMVDAITALPAVTGAIAEAEKRGYEDCLYQRGDAPDPAAIREAALEEAAKVAERYTDCCQSCAGVGTQILTLIAKGAAE